MASYFKATLTPREEFLRHSGTAGHDGMMKVPIPVDIEVAASAVMDTMLAQCGDIMNPSAFGDILNEVQDNIKGTFEAKLGEAIKHKEIIEKELEIFSSKMEQYKNNQPEEDNCG